MCFSSGSQPEKVTTQTVAAAPAAPMPAAQPALIGSKRKAENMAHFGTSTGPQTRVGRSTEVASGPNTNYRM